MVDARQSEAEQLNRNVRRSVGLHALRRIRGLVDETDAETRLQRRATRVAIVIFVALGTLAVAGIWWPAIARFLSGLI